MYCQVYRRHLVTVELPTTESTSTWAHVCLVPFLLGHQLWERTVILSTVRRHLKGVTSRAFRASPAGRVARRQRQPAAAAASSVPPTTATPRPASVIRARPHTDPRPRPRARRYPSQARTGARGTHLSPGFRLSPRGRTLSSGLWLSSGASLDQRGWPGSSGSWGSPGGGRAAARRPARAADQRCEHRRSPACSPCTCLPATSAGKFTGGRTHNPDRWPVRRLASR